MSVWHTRVPYEYTLHLPWSSNWPPCPWSQYVSFFPTQSHQYLDPPVASRTVRSTTVQVSFTQHPHSDLSAGPGAFCWCGYWSPALLAEQLGEPQNLSITPPVLTPYPLSPHFMSSLRVTVYLTLHLSRFCCLFQASVSSREAFSPNPSGWRWYCKR